MVLTLSVCLIEVAMCIAQDAQMGAWTLNEAKSNLVPGATKINTVIYEAVGDQVKVTVDGVDRTGKPTHNEWTGKFDGKDYPVTGDPNSDKRSYTKIDDHTLGLNVKKNGKLTISGRIVVGMEKPARLPRAELIRKATRSAAWRCRTSSELKLKCASYVKSLNGSRRRSERTHHSHAIRLPE